jgi:hypothetical protein
MAGVPAIVKRRLTEDEQHRLHHPTATYAELARAHGALIDPHSHRKA